MKHIAFALVFMLFTAGELYASDCGNGLPCGPIPWGLPPLPRLLTPTPIPIVDESDNAPTSVPPANIDSPDAPDVTGLDEQIATLNAILNTTPVGVSNVDGSFNDPDMQATAQANMGQNAGSFFSYVRGLGEVNFGVLTPLVVTLISGFTLIFIVKGSAIILPIVMVVFGFIRKIVNTILEFIPL